MDIIKIYLNANINEVGIIKIILKYLSNKTADIFVDSGIKITHKKKYHIYDEFIERETYINGLKKNITIRYALYNCIYFHRYKLYIDHICINNIDKRIGFIETVRVDDNILTHDTGYICYPFPNNYHYILVEDIAIY